MRPHLEYWHLQYSKTGSIPSTRMDILLFSPCCCTFQFILSSNAANATMPLWVRSVYLCLPNHIAMKANATLQEAMFYWSSVSNMLSARKIMQIEYIFLARNRVLELKEKTTYSMQDRSSSLKYFSDRTRNYAKTRMEAIWKTRKIWTG